MPATTDLALAASAALVPVAVHGRLRSRRLGRRRLEERGRFVGEEHGLLLPTNALAALRVEVARSHRLAASYHLALLVGGASLDGARLRELRDTLIPGMVGGLLQTGDLFLGASALDQLQIAMHANGAFDWCHIPVPPGEDITSLLPAGVRLDHDPS